MATSRVPRPPATFAISRWLFLRLLGCVYLVAFVSLSVQITGLAGERGILPVGEFLERAHEVYGAQAYREWPTLAWLSATDPSLSALCWTGIAASLLLIAGIVPAATAALSWLLYLSLTIAGQQFLQFQWDALLLETGLLAVLYSPLSWRSRLSQDLEPPAIVRLVLWTLAFKLTFLSGITKLVSGDPTWAAWTALSYHYETQPIPTWTSWFMHQAPPWVHYWSTLGTLVVELAVPFLIFAPSRFSRARLTACVVMTLLQVGIGVTGNYGFFGLLTVVVYLSLLDDRAFERFLPGRARHVRAHGPLNGGLAWRIGVSAVALGIAGLSAMALVREIESTSGRRPIDGGWTSALLASVAPLHSINGYGLFRVMTTERPEIVIEVSDDGRVWREQEFRWKAGDVARRPRFVQPHMPRLDWQMWFAALDPGSAQGWLSRLLERILAGEPAVTRLLAPEALGHRPRYVRLAYYQYRFTSREERAKTGAWWKRDFVGYLTDPVGN